MAAEGQNIQITAASMASTRVLAVNAVCIDSELHTRSYDAVLTVLACLAGSGQRGAKNMVEMLVEHGWLSIVGLPSRLAACWTARMALLLVARVCSM